MRPAMGAFFVLRHSAARRLGMNCLCPHFMPKRHKNCRLIRVYWLKTNNDSTMLSAIKIPKIIKARSEKVRLRFGLNLGCVGPLLRGSRFFLCFAMCDLQKKVGFSINQYTYTISGAQCYSSGWVKSAASRRKRWRKSTDFSSRSSKWVM